MKTLIFFRHGKSDWKADYSEDHNRPLAQRGRSSARIMGKLLQDMSELPDSIICSSAVRAYDTLKIAQTEGKWGTIPTRITSRLYLSGPNEIIREVHREGDDRENLMLVGHEPTWSEMVGMLVGTANIRFPTAAMARINFNVDRWKDIQPGLGQLVWLIPPRPFI